MAASGNISVLACVRVCPLIVKAEWARLFLSLGAMACVPIIVLCSEVIPSDTWPGYEVEIEGASIRDRAWGGMGNFTRRHYHEPASIDSHDDCDPCVAVAGVDSRRRVGSNKSAGGTIPYAGRLTDPDGQPVADGQYDFVFTLYASEKGDQAVWSEKQSGVSVKGGEVHTSLGASVPLPPTLSDKSATWLAVSVRRSDESDFTLLNPRQAWRTVVSAPNAVNALACPHSHFSDNWSGTAANYGLHVNNSGTGDGIRAYSASTANAYAAVYALNTATTGGGSGVWGETASSAGIGVVGKATATTDNPNSVSACGAR